MRSLLLLSLLLLLPDTTWATTRARAIDGDTLALSDGTKIRLYGVDSPEGGQAFGQGATEFARSLIHNQEVEIEVLYLDRYGRSVALVILPSGKSMQEEMLAAGLAWVAQRYCKRAECTAWLRLERAARDEGRGLWQDSAPVPPWIWRKR